MAGSTGFDPATSGLTEVHDSRDYRSQCDAISRNPLTRQYLAEAVPPTVPLRARWFGTSWRQVDRASVPGWSSFCREAKPNAPTGWPGRHAWTLRRPGESVPASFRWSCQLLSRPMQCGICGRIVAEDPSDHFSSGAACSVIITADAEEEKPPRSRPWANGRREGGKARWEELTAEVRSELMHWAILARWRRQRSVAARGQVRR